MLKCKYEQIIAIDPDSTKSGVACLDLKEKEVWGEAMSFPKVIDYFYGLKKIGIGCPFLLVVEAGYLNKKANWHSNRNVGTAGKIGENTGRNHQTAILLVEMAKHYGLNVLEAKPLKKVWKTRDGKINQEQLNGILTGNGYNKLQRVNQDVRDAVLLAIAYSGVNFSIK